MATSDEYQIIRLLQVLKEKLGDDFSKLEVDEIESLRKFLPHVDVIQRIVPHADYLVKLALNGKATQRFWGNNRSRIIGLAGLIAAITAIASFFERIVGALGWLG